MTSRLFPSRIKAKSLNGFVSWVLRYVPYHLEPYYLPLAGQPTSEQQHLVLVKASLHPLPWAHPLFISEKSKMIAITACQIRLLLSGFLMSSVFQNIFFFIFSYCISFTKWKFTINYCFQIHMQHSLKHKRADTLGRATTQKYFMKC